MSTQLRVIIVGAGIGGLAAAVALRRVGAQVEVCEQAPAFARVGAGLQLGPNATKALSGLGLLDAVNEIACTPEAWRSFDARDGSVDMELPLGESICERYGSPYLHVHRGDLHDVLLAAFRDVHTGQRVVGVDQGPTEVSVSFADDSRATADAVIGADGVHSTVRELLLGPQSARFSGLVAYRGIVPAERAQETPRVAAKWWGDDRHFVHYWISCGRELNYVAPVPELEWTEETWSAEGEVGELLEALSDFPTAARKVAGEATSLMRSALYDRDPLPRWSDGRVSLLGDACHPMLPFMAQGAGMAIEDAVLLARCLAPQAAEPDGTEIAAAFSRYEQLRLPRTAITQRGSRANEFLRGTNGGPSAEEIYAYDAWSVPISS